MASVRILKKFISGFTDELVISSLFAKSELTEKDAVNINAILSEIYDFEDEFRARAQHPVSKDNPKQVKKYYKGLLSDMDKKAKEIIDKIEQL